MTLLYTSQSADAQVPERIIATTEATGATSVYAADLDGDGKKDMLSTSIDDKVAWYENQAGESTADADGFGPQQLITKDLGNPESVYAADLDGDGDNDVLAASSFDDTVVWYENDGSGKSFTPHPITTDAAGAQSVVAADLDGDGDDDVLFGASTDDKVAWHENQVGESGADADGFGEQYVITTAAADVRSVVAADLDGDDARDAVFAAKDDDKIGWHENQTGESGADTDGFGAQQVITTSATGAKSIHAADLNGSGDKDLVSTGEGLFGGHLNWYKNDGGGNFTSRSVATTEGQSVYASDLDGDDDEDLMVGTSDEIVWHKNDGSGSFASQTITTEVSVAESVYAADLTGGGGTDVLAVSSTDDKVAWHENQIGESEADSDGFGPQQVVTIKLGTGQSVYAADLDGDEKRDVLSASRFDDKIAWYKNQVGGSTADSDGFGQQQVITLGAAGARSVRAADLDGDGDRDVLSAAFDPLSDESELAWYENQLGESGADGDGFGPKQVLTTSRTGARSVRAADFDEDGDQDVVSAFSKDGEIVWHENDGSGSFTSHVVTTDAAGAQSVGVTDLDGDGDNDAVSASSVDNAVAWYENQLGESGGDTDGFGPRQTITTNASEARSVFAADLTGDGDKDVASASSGDNKVAWYENQIGESGADSDGFGDQQTVTLVAQGARSVYTADLNGDSAVDLLSASDGDAAVSWYKNEGGGDFSPKQTFNTASSLRSVFAADLDGDGDKDVLSAGADIIWHENTEGALPVELTSFVAQRDRDKVRLTWVTASEQDNAGFQVQRRHGEESWTTIGRVGGAGTTTSPRSYRFTDEDLPYEANKLSYRLKQVDTDGTAHYSDPVAVRRSVDEVELLGPYPNPAPQRARVRYALPETQEVNLKLYDVLGRQVRTLVQAEKEGRHEQQLDTTGLPSGVYFLRLEAGETVRTQKLTVVR